MPSDAHTLSGGEWVRDSHPAPEWRCLGDPDNAPCIAAAPCSDCVTIHYMRYVDRPTALREMQAAQDEDQHHHADRMLCGLVMALADQLGEADQVGAIVRAYNACPKWYE